MLILITYFCSKILTFCLKVWNLNSLNADKCIKMLIDIVCNWVSLIVSKYLILESSVNGKLSF